MHVSQSRFESSPRFSDNSIQNSVVVTERDVENNKALPMGLPYGKKSRVSPEAKAKILNYILIFLAIAGVVAGVIIFFVADDPNALDEESAGSDDDDSIYIEKTPIEKLNAMFGTAPDMSFFGGESDSRVLRYLSVWGDSDNCGGPLNSPLNCSSEVMIPTPDLV